MNGTNTVLKVWSKDRSDAIAIICCLGMIGGFLFSRALLSMSIIGIFFNALHPSFVKGYFLKWRKSTFALASLAFFISYLVSGIWSSNQTAWLHSVIDKIPFAVLPFAFFSIPFHNKKWIKILVYGLLIMHVAVVLNSIIQLCLDPDYYMSGYSFSKSLTTTKYGDHIRFSLSLALSCLIIAFFIFEDGFYTITRSTKRILMGCLILFVAYIHLLAAKTGILCLYIAALIYVIQKAGKRNIWLALGISLFILALPYLAYRTVPTFQTKIDYVRYEYQKSKAEQRYDYTLSDAGRMITYFIGSKAIEQHYLIGVGAGDLMPEMKKGYAKYYAEVPEQQQFGPINQFMFTALCVGIPMTVFLLVMALSPFFYTTSNRLYLSITTFVLLVAINVEAMLEVQFGVLIYLFFILFWQNFLNVNAQKIE